VLVNVLNDLIRVSQDLIIVNNGWKSADTLVEVKRCLGHVDWSDGQLHVTKIGLHEKNHVHTLA